MALVMLVCLSGHSGAGKSPLLNAVARHYPHIYRAVMYTSRPPRRGEIHGQDYYFASRSAIKDLPHKSFLVGEVHSMVQALDLDQLELDLRTRDAVVVDIFDRFRPELIERMRSRLGNDCKFSSVCLTAVDPVEVLALPEAERVPFISKQVRGILERRGKNLEADIQERSSSAAREVLDAILPSAQTPCDLVIHSSPEGPEGRDDWTRTDRPIGRAHDALAQFVNFISDV